MVYKTKTITIAYEDCSHSLWLGPLESHDNVMTKNVKLTGVCPACAARTREPRSTNRAGFRKSRTGNRRASARAAAQQTRDLRDALDYLDDLSYWKYISLS